jgi:hypothetical protein
MSNGLVPTVAQEELLVPFGAVLVTLALTKFVVYTLPAESMVMPRGALVAAQGVTLVPSGLILVTLLLKKFNA